MGLIKIIATFEKITIILILKFNLMKKIIILILAILCLTSLEIYSSKQELKFDAPSSINKGNGNARSDYGPPSSGGTGCWYFGGAGCVKFSHTNCVAEASNNCEGFTTNPGRPE